MREHQWNYGPKQTDVQWDERRKRKQPFHKMPPNIRRSKERAEQGVLTTARGRHRPKATTGLIMRKVAIVFVQRICAKINVYRSHLLLLLLLLLTSPNHTRKWVRSDDGRWDDVAHAPNAHTAASWRSAPLAYTKPAHVAGQLSPHHRPSAVYYDLLNRVLLSSVDWGF